MSRHRRVETAMWGDSKFRELSRPEPNGQTLWVYLLCGPRTTIFPGLIVATQAVIASDLGWPLSPELPLGSAGGTGLGSHGGTGPRGLIDAWREVGDRGMAVADWTAGVIMLPRALFDSRNRVRDASKPGSPNALIGWGKAWGDIPECRIKDQYLSQLEKMARALGKPYSAAFRRAFHHSGTDRGSDGGTDGGSSGGTDGGIAPGLATLQEQEQDLSIGSARAADPDSIRIHPDPEPILPGDHERGGAPQHDASSAERAAAARARLDSGDPRSAEVRRLLGVLVPLHVEIFNRVRADLGLAGEVPAMQVLGDPAERALRELLVAQAGLSGFEDAARHVLRVREAEARRKLTVRFLGALVWGAGQFAAARSMRVSEAGTGVGGGKPPQGGDYPSGEVPL